MKFKIFKKICFLVALLCSAASAINFGEAVKAYDLSGQASEKSVIEFSRRKTFDSGIMCIETFKCFPEETIHEKDEKSDCDIYMKKVELSKEYKHLKKDKNFKTVTKYSTTLKFTYNKQDFVYAESEGLNDTAVMTQKHWNLMNLREIFPPDKVALISIRYILHKENRIGDIEYVMNGHNDVMCSITGKIGINSDMH